MRTGDPSSPGVKLPWSFFPTLNQAILLFMSTSVPLKVAGPLYPHHVRLTSAVMSPLVIITKLTLKQIMDLCRCPRSKVFKHKVLIPCTQNVADPFSFTNATFYHDSMYPVENCQITVSCTRSKTAIKSNFQGWCFPCLPTAR